jgi:tetratricopeptide (TPR) repeat protein
LKLASGYYVAGSYQDAVRLYSLAAILNHLDARPFKGMAMSLQKLNHHDVALDCLGAALLQDPADLEMVEMAAESMAMNGQAEQAGQIRQQLNANQNTQKNRNGYASYPDVTHT